MKRMKVITGLLAGLMVCMVIGCSAVEAAAARYAKTDHCNQPSESSSDQTMQLPCCDSLGPVIKEFRSEFVTVYLGNVPLVVSLLREDNVPLHPLYVFSEPTRHLAILCTLRL